ncbi:MAG: 50S ribosomal protein L5 [Candidatus Midichloria mitochondrii]|uniref:Large ribosomal subunit protein uL5 n=2 Tax=Candidatus Midichloria mitochondrii TaxID=234827 RepID=F7XUL2_MIDMI|nr:50S ribosomal protein L5 [Candidatus Midichloria mitochondrii]AEI88361.1 ribosomal protein L5 [Candidatus Midichloria mitochondrii IricVA]MDJ1256349.1 50S ribosomal protein L5 [Candidatus Midichloria mitochondrii]MDJ1288055.1 50S ribosomal protein L5 [Candidatus Midichloria mitochondrii]MDJ1298893.1 50S ribosomal protein L5 [Candidatus Midichloria mitochondrii]MDJ1313109.1 50S ribosomal protein L5 [Candidatus Midichloria mitochondrii]
MSKARLEKHYLSVVLPFLQKKFGYKNIMQAPRIEKVVINMGIKDAVSDSKVMDQIVAELMLITGQKPIVTKAAKSIAAFKLRKGMPIGCKVTLRKKMMYEFLDRLINIALPRGKDFRGLSSKQFDGDGNFAFGLKEHTVFPEIDYDKITTIRGMGIVVVTNAKNNEESKALLEGFNVPFIS